MNKEVKFKTGDLIEVKRSDGNSFKGIVIENYGSGFVTKVLSSEGKIGTSIWERYGLEKDIHFQSTNECVDIQVISESVMSKGSSTFTLNESVTKNDVICYETKLEDGSNMILCMCEGYGGWSLYRDGEEITKATAIKESFFNSQLSKLTGQLTEI